MAQRIVQVDAFTDRPFSGNPAAVCLLETPREAAWMQDVAREMNLSETAFLVPGEEAGAFGLRWFTPSVEVELCGHATLAAAHVLWEDEVLAPRQRARFQTRSGVLTAWRADDRIVMDFPATPPVAAEPPPSLAEVLGAAPRYFGRSRFDAFVELADAGAVRALRPDLGALRELPVRGLIATAGGDAPGVDFVSRFFAPAVGVDEDPVTGSAHCALGPYWAGRLGKDELVGYQASARGGTVHVGLAGDRLLLGGQAVTVLRARLLTD